MKCMHVPYRILAWGLLVVALAAGCRLGIGPVGIIGFRIGAQILVEHLIYQIVVLKNPKKNVVKKQIKNYLELVLETMLIHYQIMQ